MKVLMITEIMAIFRNFVSHILKNMYLSTCVCMSSDYFMYFKFLLALRRGNDEVDKCYVLKIHVLICIKGSCIRYKINEVVEDIKHWGFALMYAIKKLLNYILNCNK